MSTKPTPTTLMEIDNLGMTAAKGKALTNTLMLALDSKESVIPAETLELALYDILDKFALLEEGIDNIKI